jgi:hypothetical protein
VRDPVILIGGELYTLAEALAWLRARYGVTGPILSSERP